MTETPLRILLVDDEPENLKALERSLRSHFSVTACTSPTDALTQIDQNQFAAVVSDQRMPLMNGTDFLAKVAEKQPLCTRVILTAYTDSKEIMAAINRAEIFRYITKPWDNAELVSTIKQAVNHHTILSQNLRLLKELETTNQGLANKEKQLTTLNQELEKLVEQRTAELRAANERLSELAMTDPLTKIANRRAFFMKFNEELERSKRYKHAITVAMIDVDHFKTFNDMEGHVFGDEALRKIANLLQTRLRKTDFLGRYGGEEFILMMPETNLHSGAEICERLRVAVEQQAFQGSAEPAYMTVSIGVAGFPQHGQSAEELVKAADHALYEAKECGRNRVVREG